MAKEYEYTDIPANLKGKPLKWDDVNKEWVAYDGIESVNVSDVEVSNLPSDYPDSAVKAELESIKEEQQAINSKLDSIIENGAVNTQLTGSNVEKVYILKGVAVTSSDRITTLTNVSKYNSFSIFAQSTLNVNTTLQVRKGNFQKIYFEGSWVVPSEIELDASIKKIDTEPTVKSLITNIEEVGIYIMFEDAPTTGALNLWIEGVPN